MLELPVNIAVNQGGQGRRRCSVLKKRVGMVGSLKCWFGFIPLIFGNGQNVKVNTVVILGACF